MDDDYIDNMEGVIDDPRINDLPASDSILSDRDDPVPF